MLRACATQYLPGAPRFIDRGVSGQTETPFIFEHSFNPGGDEVIAIRGATSVDKDTPEHVRKRVKELFEEIISKNRIKRIEAIIFSVTNDIRSLNPATVLREDGNLDDVALMCFQEAQFEGSPERIIRILLFCDSDTREFVYLHDAQKLRPDIAEVKG